MFNMGRFNGVRERTINLGHLLECEKPEDAYIVVREMTVGEAVKWRELKDEEEISEYAMDILPDVITDHNFETDEGKADNKAVAEYLKGKGFSVSRLIQEEMAILSFFIRPPKSSTT